MNKINDSVFGKMEYDFGWEGKEMLDFWGDKYEIKIFVQSYSQDSISKLQQEKYKEYKLNIERYHKEISDELLKFYKMNYDEISNILEDIPESYDKQHINTKNITHLIEVETLFFAKDGRYGYLCDCAWDEENGIGILLSDENVKIIEQDELV